MSAAITRGKISFIEHHKQYATIEYTAGGKKKTITGYVSEAEQQKWKDNKIIKKIHHFHIGDEVNFVIELSARGDKMIATNIQYITNEGLSNILNKAATIENKFVGYLKLADDRYFIKETGSYFLFPLILSPWEHDPASHSLNEPVMFSLDNFESPDKVTARLYKSRYIPEYKTAQQYHKDKKVIPATVFKVGPHGIYLNLIGENIQAKLPVKDQKEEDLPKVGDTINVRIAFLSHMRIIVEKV